MGFLDGGDGGFGPDGIVNVNLEDTSPTSSSHSESRNEEGLGQEKKSELVI